MNIFLLIVSYIRTVKYDYINDTFTLNGKIYELKPYRKWLLANQSDLCTNHFIKAILKDKKIVFTFDWQCIYFTASEYGIINEYINSL